MLKVIYCNVLNNLQKACEIDIERLYKGLKLSVEFSSKKFLEKIYKKYFSQNWVQVFQSINQNSDNLNAASKCSMQHIQGQNIFSTLEMKLKPCL